MAVFICLLVIVTVLFTIFSWGNAVFVSENSTEIIRVSNPYSSCNFTDAQLTVKQQLCCHRNAVIDEICGRRDANEFFKHCMEMRHRHACNLCQFTDGYILRIVAMYVAANLADSFMIGIL